MKTMEINLVEEDQTQSLDQFNTHILTSEEAEKVCGGDWEVLCDEHGVDPKKD